MGELRSSYLLINNLFFLGLEDIQCYHFDQCFPHEYHSESVVNLVVDSLLSFKFFLAWWRKYQHEWGYQYAHHYEPLEQCLRLYLFFTPDADLVVFLEDEERTDAHSGPDLFQDFIALLGVFHVLFRFETFLAEQIGLNWSGIGVYWRAWINKEFHLFILLVFVLEFIVFLLIIDVI